MRTHSQGLQTEIKTTLSYQEDFLTIVEMLAAFSSSRWENRTMLRVTTGSSEGELPPRSALDGNSSIICPGVHPQRRQAMTLRLLFRAFQLEIFGRAI